MKKFLVGCAISTSLLAFSGVASAQEITREGSVFTKIGVQGIFPTAENKSKDAAGNVAKKSKFKNAVGVELAGTYFFTDNFAAELGVSYTQYKLKNVVGSTDTLKTNAVPVTLMLQYHTPTFGFASPYVGAGYSYAFLQSKKNKESTVKRKAKNVSAPVLQVGSNFDLGESFGLNLDVKQFWLKPKYKVADKKEKYKMNPTVVTLGVTYKF
ncbi:Outer membrane protein W [Rickettsiales bacterium Ac37b]|nr:Outer membrane protein W [Rickettsiales bacterium Ac37b]